MRYERSPSLINLAVTSRQGLSRLGPRLAQGGGERVAVKVAADGLADPQAAGGQVDLPPVQAVQGAAQGLARLDREDARPPGAGFGLDPLVRDEGRAILRACLGYHGPGLTLLASPDQRGQP